MQLIMFNEVNDRDMEEEISRAQVEFAEYDSINLKRGRGWENRSKSRINLANFRNFDIMPRR